MSDSGASNLGGEHLTKDGQPDKRFKEHGGGTHGHQGESFDTVGDGSSSLVTEGTGEEEGFYKPSEHDGLTKDGEVDKRTKSEHGFGGNKELASEAGKKGGEASYDNGGLTK